MFQARLKRKEDAKNKAIRQEKKKAKVRLQVITHFTTSAVGCHFKKGIMMDVK